MLNEIEEELVRELCTTVHKAALKALQLGLKKEYVAQTLLDNAILAYQHLGLTEEDCRSMFVKEMRDTWTT